MGFQNLFENLFHIFPEKVEMLLHIVLCEKVPCNLIMFFQAFKGTFAKSNILMFPVLIKCKKKYLVFKLFFNQKLNHANH